MSRRTRGYRYRRPALGELLGITQLKRRLSRTYSLARLRHPIQTPLTNLERRVKRRAGYYSEPMKLLRFLLRRNR